LATIQLALQHSGALEGHNPSLGQHQVLACPTVPAPAFPFQPEDILARLIRIETILSISLVCEFLRAFQ
jgi:hypothetical protein